MKIRSSVCLTGAVLLFLLPFLSNAQPFRRLTTRDFTGTPTNGSYAAYTYCYVSYTYQPTRHNGVYNIDFNVQLMLNSNKSWINFSQVSGQDVLQNILKHEQGHYNIAYLMKNELYSVFSRHRYTSNYQAEIAGLFKDVDAKYHKMNEDYENQTQHMTDARKQQQWDSWFSRQLDNSQIASNY